MSNLRARLELACDTIQEICRISGTPGVSFGVMHEKKIVYMRGLGYRDVEKQIAPDEDTIYYLASLSKSFTAAAAADLVEEGKAKWTTPVKDLLPDFTHYDSTIKNQSTMIDWMSHRTGLAPKNSLWTQDFGHDSMRRNATLPMVSYLEKLTDLGSRWVYMNWGYAIADLIIERLSGKSWGDFLKERIFDPLDMNRTITKHDSKLDNVANAYMAFSDGTFCHLPRPFPEDGKIMEGAVAVQSNVRDLLNYYQTWMKSAADQQSSGQTSTADSPLKQVSTMWHPHISLDSELPAAEKGYGLGWMRVQLPSTLGAIGLNPTYVGKMPLVGKGLEEPKTCFYHQGSANTFLSSVHLLPDTDTAIVVLTNSMANNDAADWIGEYLLELVLDNPQKNNYVQLAKASSTESVRRWSRMREQLKSDQVPGTTAKPLDAYCGSYYNLVGTYRIDVFSENEKLMMCFQGHRHASFDLTHHHYDIFSWLLSRDDDVRHGMFPVTRAIFYLFQFSTSGKEDCHEISQLRWVNDPAVSDGEVFRKRGCSKSGAKIQQSAL